LTEPAESLSIGPSDRRPIMIHWGQRLLVYLAASSIFAGILDWHARTILSGISILLVAALLSARLGTSIFQLRFPNHIRPIHMLAAPDRETSRCPNQRLGPLSCSRLLESLKQTLLFRKRFFFSASSSWPFNNYLLRLRPGIRR